MRNLTAAVLLMVAVPFAATAGEIYGTANPQASNLEVKILCGDQSQNVFTDQRGTYRLYISRQGECKLSVHLASGVWTEPLKIYSTEKPARYDLLIKGNRLERQ